MSKHQFFSYLMTNQKMVPLPTVLCTPKRKLCCWKMALVMESPRDVYKRQPISTARR